jgi:hypothetical protein
MFQQLNCIYLTLRKCSQYAWLLDIFFLYGFQSFLDSNFKFYKPGNIILLYAFFCYFYQNNFVTRMDAERDHKIRPEMDFFEWIILHTNKK